MMERLTYRSKTGKVYTYSRNSRGELVKHNTDALIRVCSLEALTRLASYEDTGLTPDEVVVLRTKESKEGDTDAHR
jgi:hypothetical protein